MKDQPTFQIELYEPDGPADTWRAVLTCPPSQMRREVAVACAHSAQTALDMLYTALVAEGVDGSTE